MKIVDPSVTLEWVTPDAALMIERAARTCYKSEGLIAPGSAEKLIEKIWKRGHHSCLEHASASFRIVCDRGVTHEIVRHRISSFSQESTRYCNYAKEQFGREITVIEPPGLLGESGIALWLGAVREAEVRYMALLDEGVKPEIARSVLPNCLKTEIVMTANFREWLHFLKLRTAPAAHPQMREVAGMIGEVLLKECFAVFRFTGE